MTSDEKKERLVRLRAQGVPFSEIELQLGVSKKTLIEWGRKQREDIQKERAAEIEHIRAVYWEEKRGRIDILRERLRRLHEEEGRRDLSDIPTAKVMGLELQTSEQLNKELQSLPVQISLGALGDTPSARESVDSATTTPAGRDDGPLTAGPFAAFAQGDGYDMVRAILAEQTALKGALSEIANGAASESVQIAAIKSIDAMSGRMLDLVQSTGVIATLADEHKIDEVLAGWAVRDRRELMYECVRADQGTAHMGTLALNALHDGDLEKAEELYSEFNDRVHEWARKQMHEEISALRRAPADTGP